MPDYTAKINAKGCDATGLTEEIAAASYARLGSHMMAVVELRAAKRGDDEDGTHSVNYVITQIEPATNTRADDLLRELARTLHASRRDPEGQPGLPGTDGFGAQAMDDVLRQGESLVQDGALSNDGALLTCAFPGCVLAAEHDGTHDIFVTPVAVSDGPSDD